MMPTTRFRLLHDAGACKERYRFLAKALGGIKAYGRDTPITLLQILDINGFYDALWALWACPDSDTFARLLACDYAEHVLPIFETQYPDDDRPRKAIAVSRRHAHGEATDAELSAAWAARAAWYAAEAAARDAAEAAARDAARAAWYAAEAAARDAARAAWNAAWADARDAARAAWHAAGAAGAAAWYAAEAAARDAAWHAECTWQEARLRELLERGQE
jgi:hypothetical protein